MEKGYSLVETAILFGVTRQTVRNWILTGYIKNAIKTKRKWVVPQSEIDEIKRINPKLNANGDVECNTNNI